MDPALPGLLLLLLLLLLPWLPLPAADDDRRSSSVGSLDRVNIVHPGLGGITRCREGELSPIDEVPGWWCPGSCWLKSGSELVIAVTRCSPGGKRFSFLYLTSSAAAAAMRDEIR